MPPLTIYPQPPRPVIPTPVPRMPNTNAVPGQGHRPAAPHSGVGGHNFNPAVVLITEFRFLNLAPWCLPHGVKIMILFIYFPIGGKESEANKDHVAFTETHLPD